MAAAEFALILPVLITLVLGSVDLGRFAYSHIAIHNAARAGAAYGITNSYTPNTLATWQTNVEQAARDEMTQQTGYVPQNLAVQSTTIIESSGLRRVEVQVSYPFQTIVPWPGIPTSMTMGATVEMRAIR